MNNEYTKKELQVIIDRAVKYVNSIKGQRLIDAAMKQARKMTDKLAKARKIDPKKLHDPMTI